MKIAITGESGLVGSRIIELLKNDFNFVPLKHSEFDIANSGQVTEYLDTLDFDLLLHLAAYTNVDKSEIEKNEAFSVNVIGTKNVFEAVSKKNKKMIYFSTDFVFDGVNPPFDEESIPNPIGFYGQSKYEGELFLKNKAMIARISNPYGNSPAQKPDFVKKLALMLKKGRTLSMVTDSLMTPTHIDDIAYSIKHLINHFSPETYHIVGSRSYSPFEIGRMIAEKNNISKKLILPTSFKEYSQGKAPRPQYSKIVSTKNNFHKMKSFEDFM